MPTKHIQDADHQLAGTTAALLRATAPLFWLNLLLFAGVWWRLWPLPGLPLWLLGIAALLTGSAALALQVRLAFDARLFEGFARGMQTPPQLDSALHTLGLAKSLPQRSMAARCAGALRLMRLWQCLTGLQMLLLLCMLALS